MSVGELRRLDGAASWLTVGHAADVPLLEGRSVTVGGRRIAIFRLPHGWAAVESRCPHRGGPLGDGLVAENCVTCPLHGQRFSLQSGARVDAPGPGVQSYAVRERDGMVEVCLPARAARSAG